MRVPTQQVTFQTLELRFSQLLKIADRSRSSKFPNNRIRVFHDTLLSLISKMSLDDFSTFDNPRLIWTYQIIEQVFNWFEYLVNSTVNQTPYEIINTLEEVLTDWGVDEDSYILLTSLSTRKDYFAFYTDPDPALLRGIKEFIERTYNERISQDHDIIRIVFPKFLSHDYLTAVSLYHEIGHYIDVKFKITANILMEYNLAQTEENMIFYREHFADLFAAQYVDLASCSHLCYLTFKKDKKRYPSTSDRVDLVNTFLTGGDSENLTSIKAVLKKCTGKDLKKRYKRVSERDFNNLVPIEIKSPAELHGVFILAWETWLDPKSHLRKAFKNKNDLYRILNNLVEKSISNFFLTRSWNLENVPD
jgi:hypothetical protein